MIKRLALYVLVAAVLIGGTFWFKYNRDIASIPHPSVITRKGKLPAHVAVHVADQAGNPIANASIHVQCDATSLNVRTDNAGNASITMPADGPLQITFNARSPGRVPSQQFFSARKDVPEKIEFSLAPTVKIGGIVQFADNSPAPGITVKLQQDNADGSIQKELAATDDQGHWSCNAFGDSLLHLKIQFTGDTMLPLPAPVALSDVDAAALHQGSYLTRVEHDFVVKGRIVMPDGSAPPGEPVSLSIAPQDKWVRFGTKPRNTAQHEEKCAADGTFTIHPGIKSFRLLAEHPAGYAIILSDDLATTPELKLTPWGRVTGIIHVNGAPPPPEKTFVYGVYEGEDEFDTTLHFVSWRFNQRPDATGAFSCDRVPAGEVLFGIGPRLEKTITVESGKTSKVLIGMEGALVTGKILLPPEAPSLHNLKLERLPTLSREDEKSTYLPNGQIVHLNSITDFGEDINSHTRTVALDANGAFRIPELAAGDYLLTGSASGFAISRKFSIVDGQPSLNMGEIEPVRYQPLHVGDAAPNLNATDGEGNATSLADLHGKYVLVLFARYPASRAGEQLVLTGQFYATRTPERSSKIATLLVEVDRPQKVDPYQNNFPNFFSGRAAYFDKTLIDPYDAYDLPVATLVGPDGKVLAAGLRSQKDLDNALNPIFPLPPRKPH